ncbi:MAG: type-F conjugative transfer system secretin TraK [Deferribacterales bacterium]
MRLLLLLFLLLPVFANAAITGIEPEVVTTVEMSRSDMNRIVCPYPITDFATSKENNMTYKISGNNLFIKFPVIAVTKDGELIEKKYFNGYAEVHLVCGDAVYSLILQAEQKKTEIIYLSDTAGKMKKVNEYVRSKSYEDLMTEFIQALIENKPLNDFYMNESDEKESYRGVNISVSRVMIGGGYIVKELILESKEKVSLTNTELLKLEMLSNVKAVALLSPTFSGMTKAYVVQGKVK